MEPVKKKQASKKIYIELNVNKNKSLMNLHKNNEQVNTMHKLFKCILANKTI